MVLKLKRKKDEVENTEKKVLLLLSVKFPSLVFVRGITPNIAKCFMQKFLENGGIYVKLDAGRKINCCNLDGDLEGH